MKENSPRKKSPASRVTWQKLGPPFLDRTQTDACHVPWDSICEQWVLKVAYIIVQTILKLPNYQPILSADHFLKGHQLSIIY